MRNELLSETVFGNEAGEDETPEILNSYFVSKPQFKRFWDPKRRFELVRARKGLGKSALLSKLRFDKSNLGRDNFVIYAKGADVSQFIDDWTPDPNALINKWQQALCALINLEIGRRLRLAFGDSTMTLVENSELAGYRDSNLIGALLDRLMTKLPSGRKRQPAADNQRLLHRFGLAKREFQA